MRAVKYAPVAILLLAVFTASTFPGANPRRQAEPNLLRASAVQVQPVAALQVLRSNPTSTLVAHATTTESVVFERATETSAVLTTLSNPTTTGGPLVFQVVDGSSDWLKVKLPIRPNGSVGWVKESSVDLTINHYRVAIDASDHVIQVTYRGETILETEVAIGKGSTPTPIGSFYLTELLEPSSPNGIYGPFAFGLSGYSETLQSFNGGDGVIGLHGTNDPSALGTDVSHGCVRIDNEVITELASLLPLGTPVRITA